MIVDKVKSRLQSLSPQKKEGKKLTMMGPSGSDGRGRHQHRHRHRRHSRNNDQHRYRNRVDLVDELVLPETESETETSDSSFQSSSSFAKEDMDRKSASTKKKDQRLLFPIVEANKATVTPIRGILSSTKKTSTFTTATRKNAQFKNDDNLVQVLVQNDTEENNDDNERDSDGDGDSDSDEKKSDTSIASVDLWYSSKEFNTFRSRESKIVKEMSKSFGNGSFSVDGVESLQYKLERRRRMDKSRYDVLLLQESFWEEMERMDRSSEQQSTTDDETYNQKRRDILLARTYMKASMESVVLALQRADWNAKQVRDDNKD